MVHRYMTNDDCQPREGSGVIGDRLGRDIFMVSISSGPKQDTSDVLQGYAQYSSTGPGWIFLTGKHEEIERL